MDRERITISIKKNVLNLIDSAIDGTNIRNRSHAIEFLSLKALDSSDDKNAVILLGGDNAMKSIPAVKSYLKLLSKYGYKKIYVAVGFLSEKIKEKLGDGSEFKTKLIYLEEGEGSGGALLQLKKYFRNTFIVINTEKDLDIDLEKFFRLHKKRKGTATVLTDDLSTMKGVYLFEPSIFSFIPRGFSMLEDEIFSKINTDGELIIFPSL